MFLTFRLYDTIKTICLRSGSPVRKRIVSAPSPNQTTKVFEYNQCRELDLQRYAYSETFLTPVCSTIRATNPKVMNNSYASWGPWWNSKFQHNMCVCVSHLHDFQSKQISFSTTSALPPIGFPLSFSFVLLFVVSWQGKSLSNTFHGVLRQFMATLTRRRSSLNYVLGYALKWHGK